MPNDKKKLSIWYSSLINRNSSRAWQPLSRVNVTGLLRRLQVKIENIYLFKILIKKHENVFKSWLCPNFLLLSKKSELPQIRGCCSLPRTTPPPRPVRLCGQAIYAKIRYRVSSTFATGCLIYVLLQKAIFTSQIPNTKTIAPWINRMALTVAFPSWYITVIDSKLH